MAAKQKVVNDTEFTNHLYEAFNAQASDLQKFLLEKTDFNIREGNLYFYSYEQAHMHARYAQDDKSVGHYAEHNPDSEERVPPIVTGSQYMDEDVVRCCYRDVVGLTNLFGFKSTFGVDVPSLVDEALEKCKDYRQDCEAGKLVAIPTYGG